MKTLRIAVVFSLVVTGSPSWATTIIMLYLPGRVYIATDSKIASLDGKVNGTVCKIHVAKNYIWASAGLLLETNRTFNLEQFVPNAMGDGIDFDKSVDTLEAQLKAVFPQLVEDIRATGSANIDLVQIGIALASQRRVGHVSSIFINGKELQRYDCPSQSCTETGVFSFGEHRAVDEALDANRKIWRDMGIVPALNYLIEQQAKLTPRYVKGPTAIVEITSKGVQWDEKGKCDQ